MFQPQRPISVEEHRQMEEILRIEREIERLQKQREDGVSQLCESSRLELRLRRDAEVDGRTDRRVDRPSIYPQEKFSQFRNLGNVHRKCAHDTRQKD